MNSPRRVLAPNATVTGGASVGTPLAIVLVWYLNSFALPAPMPGEIATAVGSLVVAVTGYAVQLLEGLLSIVKRN